MRVEMVCPSSRVRGVVAAAVAAHPYEEPLVIAEQATIARNAARLGMVCTAGEETTLNGLARKASTVYGCTPRIWGEPGSVVGTVATATGSAGSLVADVIAAGAHALVAGEVRYHDALNAVASGLSIIELGHDVTEWPLVDLLEAAVRSVPGLPGDAVHRLPSSRGWWTPDEVEGDM
jgi:putative NIF3 family GTP cyclohydrolase 1 type 2